MKNIIYALLILIISFSHIMAEESIPAKPVELGLQVIEVANQKYLALNYRNYPEWHTYWKNPGDAGLSIEVKFFQGKKEIKLEGLEWPVPKKFIELGDQWAFGYSGDYSLFYKLDKNFQNNLFGKNLIIKSKWLVCKNICIPGMKEINFTIARDGIQTKEIDLLTPVDTKDLESRMLKLPKAKNAPDYLSIRLSTGADNKSLYLKYEVKNSTDLSFLNKTNMFFPFLQKPFDFTHEKITTTASSTIGFVLISWDGEFQSPVEPLNPNGKFRVPYLLKFLFNDPITKETYIVEKKFTQFETTLLKVENSDMSEKKKDIVSDVESSEKTLTLYYLVMAFIGGLILNVMPCVLPIISLKLFGLIKYQQESKSRILKHNIFYTLGILSTFTIFALIIVLLKKFGTSVGWGFQLQSPSFIAIMIVALFIFSLNLFGVFEFSTPGGSKLGNMEIQNNFAGDFLGGVLATILSTPCSAPFLGTALTFAFTSSALTIFLIFLMIGLGLASPFIVTGIFPNLVSFLPKPGNWMNTLKKFLGVTLVLTTFWLLDVFNTLVGGQSHLIKLFTSLFFVFIGIQVYKKEKWIGRVSFLISFVLFVNMVNTTVMPIQDDNTSLLRDKQAKGLNWEAWSLQKMEDHKRNQQLVFIDFTAKWCFTCKVNEKIVLETDDFKALVKKHNIKLLIADWTRRDEIIGNFLMKNNLVGVPAYFIQTPDGTLLNLGETITIKKIEENL